MAGPGLLLNLGENWTLIDPRDVSVAKFNRIAQQLS